MTHVPAANPSPAVNGIDDLARLQILRYLITVCITFCLWDWALALADEFQIVRSNHGRMRISFLLSGVYYVSRCSVLGYLITNFHLAVISPTFSVVPAEALFGSITLPAASGLFYARLSAIYLHDKRAMLAFGLSWLAVFVFFVYDGVHVVLQYLSEGRIAPERIDTWSYVLNSLYDTMIYIAISWRLASFSISGDGWRDRVRSFVVGDGLLGLTKGLLQSGQSYYFMTIGFGIASAICIYTNKIPLEYKGILVIPNVTVANIMACRLYRELKIRVIHDLNMSTEYELPTLVFTRNVTFDMKDAYEPKASPVPLSHRCVIL